MVFTYGCNALVCTYFWLLFSKMATWMFCTWPMTKKKERGKIKDWKKYLFDSRIVHVLWKWIQNKHWLIELDPSLTWQFSLEILCCSLTPYIWIPMRPLTPLGNICIQVPQCVWIEVSSKCHVILKYLHPLMKLLPWWGHVLCLTVETTEYSKVRLRQIRVHFQYIVIQMILQGVLLSTFSTPSQRPQLINSSNN